MNSGLPSNNVTSIAFDHTGAKWIGTRSSGLAKFNDSIWTVYNTSNSSLPSNEITSIAIDHNDTKWIGTYGGGLVKIEDTTWTIYNTTNSVLPSDSITAVATEANGNVWIGTIHGLAKLEGMTCTIYNTSNSGLFLDWVSLIAIDPIGNKWIGSYLTKFDNTTWTSYQPENAPCSSVSAIAIDPNGVMWIGYDCHVYGGCLYRYDGFHWTKYSRGNSGLQYDDVLAIAIDANGNKWLGSMEVYFSGQSGFSYYGGGLTKFDGVNWTSYFASNSGLPDDFVNLIAIDVHDNKWLATMDNSGLTVFREGGVILGVGKNIQQSIDILLLPNPANDKITISTSCFSIDKVCIFNMLGVKVMEKTGMGTQMVIDLSNLLSGAYVVQVQTENGFETKRLVVEKR
jgi:ligand-binding sensor domain-containing protein